MIPAASPIANSLISKPGLDESTRNANIRISAALVTSLPVRASPSSIAWFGRAGLVVGLAHAREHEDLVVHREAEQEREDHQRDPGGDRLRRRDVPERRAVALLEDEDDDPERGRERDEVQDRGLDRAARSSGTPARAGSASGSARTRARRGSCRRSRARSRGRPPATPPSVPSVPFSAALTRLTIPWIPGAAPSIAGNASTSESEPRCQPAGDGRADDARRPSRTFAAIALRVAAVLDEDVERLHHARADAGVGEHLRGRRSRCRCRGSSSAATRSGSAAGRAPTSTADDREADGRDRHTGGAARSAPSGPRRRPRDGRWSTNRFGITRTLLIRVPSTASSAGSSVIAAITETAGISMPPMPDRADERQRQDDQREQADRHGRAGDDHRAAGVRHRLDERGLDVFALAQLVAEAEDHQQRVVDRDAEPDERDQELDDDRDVRDVGQDPDRA